ncbi:type II toxin-antitoxin system death-on-curing family toxin [Alloprevotella tannerae]
MENLRQDIKANFERIVRKYNPNTKAFAGGLSEMEVLKAHYIISDYFISEGESVFFGVKSFDLLSSAIARQHVEFAGIQKWEDCYHKMATLLFGLDKNHAFEDGNKRTALLSLLLYINKEGLQITYKQQVLEDLLVRIAANELSIYETYNKYYVGKEDAEVNFIADFIKKCTRKTSKKVYTITYEEFNRRLKRFGVCLANPTKGNYINVYQRKEIRKFFRKKEKEERILQIGFPGWKRQINPKAIKSVLSEAGLTAENGVDSDVFFRDAEPAYELIREYRNPLRRLKDK